MNSKDYWANREADQLAHNITEEAAYDKEINRIYTEMLDACQSEIDRFYGQYARAEGITIADAKKRVSRLDIAAYERKARKYVRERDFSDKANEEMRLYNATMKINRLEMLKANIGLELISGHDELEKYMGDILQGRTEDELARQAGILGKTIKNNAAKAHAIVNGSFHNGTFSDRIWQYQDLMREDLGRLLQTGLIQGKNPRALAKDLRKCWFGNDPKTGGGAKYCMERLMRTELARVQTEAQKQSFKRNGFDFYEFICNKNPTKHGTCSICRALNGKHFKVEDMMPGTNAPPMHPHCRCSTAAWEDSEEYEAWLDHLANGGTTEEWNKRAKSGYSDKFTDAGFSRISGEHSYTDDAKAVNPHFYDGYEYEQNCSHTVPAYEMRRRGYNVTATGAKNNDIYKQAGMRAWGYADHSAAVKAGAVTYVTSKRSNKIAAEIEEALLKAGKGTRFEIRVGWKSGGGHFFVGENIDGKVVFIDPQSGEHNDSVRAYMNDSKPSATWYARIDNIELDPEIMKDLCEVDGK